MFDWIPETARSFRSELVELYWIFLVLVSLLVIVFQFFRIAEDRVDSVDVLKRIVISIMLLWSFEEVINLISLVTDGIVERMGGLGRFKKSLSGIGESLLGKCPSSFKLSANVYWPWP